MDHPESDSWHEGQAEEAGASAVNPWMSEELESYYGYSPINRPSYVSDDPRYVPLAERSEVYKAYHVASRAPVALKKIMFRDPDEGVPLAALREVKLLKSLKHDNLLSLLDMAVAKGGEHLNPAEFYMVTPYMDHDLSGLLSNPNIKLTIPQIKYYMKQLFEGLGYLHHKQILHRDLNLTNILVSNKGILKIADFGLSRYNLTDDALTNCDATRWYRAPELLLGATDYSYAVDMWGAGCIFSHMLMDKPLFPGKSDIEQLNLIFDVCGSPTTVTMPGWQTLPGASIITVGAIQHSRVHEWFGDFDGCTIDLLQKLLTLDPLERVTAEEALGHFFFTSAPLPAVPSSFASYPSCHTIDNPM